MLTVAKKKMNAVKIRKTYFCGSLYIFLTIVNGRCLGSIKIFERYIPITPIKEIITPPKSQIDAITDFQPSGAVR
jgi:hypothetical protein